MSDRVQFEDDGSVYSRYNSLNSPSGYNSGLSRFLINMGLVGNERQALILSVVIAVVVLCIAVLFLKQALAEPQIIELRVK